MYKRRASRVSEILVQYRSRCRQLTLGRELQAPYADPLPDQSDAAFPFPHRIFAEYRGRFHFLLHLDATDIIPPAFTGYESNENAVSQVEISTGTIEAALFDMNLVGRRLLWRTRSGQGRKDYEHIKGQSDQNNDEPEQGAPGDPIYPHDVIFSLPKNSLFLSEPFFNRRSIHSTRLA